MRVYENLYSKYFLLINITLCYSTFIEYIQKIANYAKPLAL